LYNDWSPTTKDLEIIRERITQRINQKPNWYRWTKSNRQSTAISV